MNMNGNFSYWQAAVVLILLSPLAQATELDKVESWYVGGAHGVLQVQGALTVSACRLDMSSALQTVDLGNVDTGKLQQVGKQGMPIAVQLRLEDCFISESRNHEQLGNQLWSPNMPAMRLRFVAPATAENPLLIAVSGAKGLGLLISDHRNVPITPGVYRAPTLVSSGQNELTYYITPVRTSAGLDAGAYWAQIQFHLSYD
ncbi:TPA: type 1 fimbrial protein [Raoultella ornithinolytica]|nr:type 1 fimbrial protein [Klebsiella pasteurii]HAT3652293.1 type 1 fimbrial protein [Raoultella ornithinolytica]HCI9061440.1 type 1 fimbrial protein [Klebsiella quasipneumoniae]